jgi:hypothetical protein
MFGKIALDWTQEMERRLYEKTCGRLTCCGGEEEEAGSGKGAHIYDTAEAGVFGRPSA